MTWVRIEDGKVAERWDKKIYGTDFDLQKAIPNEDFLRNCKLADDEVQCGWVYEEGKFSPPPLPEVEESETAEPDEEETI